VKISNRVVKITYFIEISPKNSGISFIFRVKIASILENIVIFARENKLLDMGGGENKKHKKIAGLNRYQFFIVTALIAMLFFFSDSSLLKKAQYDRQIKELKKQIEFYRAQIDTNKTKLNELQSNKDDLEKFARENYLMKKENEEVFIIE
jgi:cell division protein DivIC